MSTAKPPGLSVCFLLTHEFTLTAFAAFLDVLRLAADKGVLSRQRNCRWTVLSVGNDHVLSSSGIRIPTERYSPDPKGFDYVVVVGGIVRPESRLSPQDAAFLRATDGAGVPLVGLDSGSLLMQRAGLMEGVTHCAHWFDYLDYVAEDGSRPPTSGQIFLEQGNRITCAGGTSAADLAIWLVDRHMGERWSNKCQRMMIMSQRRAPTHPQPTVITRQVVQCTQLREAMRLIELNIFERFSTEELAKQVGLSKRSLERKFRDQLGQGPQEFCMGLRLELAGKQLANTDNAVTDIAYQCGFKNLGHFSRAFRKRFSQSPSGYRQDARS